MQAKAGRFIDSETKPEDDFTLLEKRRERSLENYRNHSFSVEIENEPKTKPEATNP